MIGVFSFFKFDLIPFIISCIEHFVCSVMLYLLLAIFTVLPVLFIHLFYRTKLTKDILTVFLFFTLWMSILFCNDFKQFFGI